MHPLGVIKIVTRAAAAQLSDDESVAKSCKDVGYCEVEGLYFAAPRGRISCGQVCLLCSCALYALCRKRFLSVSFAERDSSRTRF